MSEVDTAAVAAAVAALRRGEVVGYPTETFYGLGVGAFDEAALGRLRALKGRGVEKAFSVIIAGPEMLDRLCVDVSPVARRLMAAHWPGPLTLALPARPGLPESLVLDGCVAVRESPNAYALALVRAFGAPVTATSANRSGEPAVRTAAEVAAVFGGQVHLLDGGTTPGGAASTLARVRGERVEVLRPGPIAVTPTG